MDALELRDKANELLLISNNAKQQLQEIKTIETGVDYLNTNGISNIKPENFVYNESYSNRDLGKSRKERC